MKVFRADLRSANEEEVETRIACQESTTSWLPPLSAGLDPTFYAHDPDDPEATEMDRSIDGSLFSPLPNRLTISSSPWPTPVERPRDSCRCLDGTASLVCGPARGHPGDGPSKSAAAPFEPHPDPHRLGEAECLR